MFQCSTASPLSGFQVSKLFNKLKQRCPELTELITYPHYFLACEQKLSEKEMAIALSLLRATTTLDAPYASSYKIVVVPRIGTISPWSSKATDIFHHCNLQNVQRIEQGWRYYLLCPQQNLTQVQLLETIQGILYDPLTQSVLFDENDAEILFEQAEPAPLTTIDILDGGITALTAANQARGFALNMEEMEYLLGSYQALGRNPSDVELMMFAQINSEHCRHKIFNADWQIDQKRLPDSLFAMIKQTYQRNPEGIILAYKDNAAIISGTPGQRFFADPVTHHYQYHEEPIHFVFKVETHNHPTAISPFPGAATGCGGEIRDEGATGIGAQPKAGLTGFSVSHLSIPDYTQPWELTDASQPKHVASALEIMLDGPIGGASFNNEFGRPNILGYFRNFEIAVEEQPGQWLRRGYHKPIMIAGGIGNIRESHCQKQALTANAVLVVLGGPAMRIGLGGGAASSLSAGVSSQALDFASVQRGNPEMQRRAQEVINACWALGENNPILSIHDVGAGGLSNALPEIVHDAARGAQIELRTILNDEPGMSPLEIWCNESQERYVIAIDADSVDQFSQIAARERCPFAVVGQVTDEEELIVGDGYFDNLPIAVPMPLLFGKAPKMLRQTQHRSLHKKEFATAKLDLTEAVERVLQFPTVASKEFLITIGDRSVMGLVARDQMVGPWQIPVADVAVTAASYEGFTGEAMAMGERTPIAVLHPAASGRMAIAEAITNIAAADIAHITDIKLSANWMADASYPGDDAALYATVQAVATEMCRRLGLVIPVGKDSLSMRCVWQDEQAGKQQVIAPVSLIISAAAAVQDIRHTLTPQCHCDPAVETTFLLIDLGKGQNRLGASILAQCYGELGHHAPDCEDPESLLHFFNFIQQQRAKILAYHDRSDGGVLVTLLEMAFASHCGLRIDISALGTDPFASLFNEECGAVIQIALIDKPYLLEQLHAVGLGHHVFEIASIRADDQISIHYHHEIVYQSSREHCQRLWQETSYRLQALRDNPACAEEAFQHYAHKDDPGLHAALTFDLQELNQEGGRLRETAIGVRPHEATTGVRPREIFTGVRPRVGILREQGVNGHQEMAAAFYRAGFESVDVHMQDIVAGNIDLASFQGLVACGGFSFGDVLGAGRGWANSILYHERVREKFALFFQRPDTFTLGVCNGCQMLSHLRDIIPGAEHWPVFLNNRSGQFEARLSMVEVVQSPSLFFADMAGSRMPVVVSHGEGLATFSSAAAAESCQQQQQVCLRYVDNHGKVTERYPANPNGSPLGVTGVCTRDGRVTLLMPHPERVFRTTQLSWYPTEWRDQALSPWFKLFVNAKKWLK